MIRRSLPHLLILLIFFAVDDVNLEAYTIFHASDFSGRFGPIRTRTGALVGGLARLHGYLSGRDTSRYGKIKFIFTGNFIRQPYSTRPNRVLIERQLIEKIKPDVVTLAYNEYHLEISNYERYSHNFPFPVVSSNLDMYNSKKDYQIDEGSLVIMSFVPDHYQSFPLVFTSGYIEMPKMLDVLGQRIEEYKKNNPHKEMIFIATGCAGIDVAKNIADNVSDIDIVISGCSRTMQWNEGEPPEYIKKDSGYPLLYETTSGKTVLIAHSYGSTKFLGKLTLNVDAQGEIHSHKGEMLYLNDKFPEAEGLKPIIDKLYEVEIAHSRVYLNGQCKKLECNLGNLITDSFIQHKVTSHKSKFYSDTSIALMSARNIKANIEVSIYGGVILVEDLLYVINPHQQLVTVEIKGSALRKTIEFFIEKSNTTNGLFLQVSGLHIRYDRRNLPRKRLVALLVRCANCDIPTYADMIMGKMYRVITTVDMLNATTGYVLFSRAAKVIRMENTTDFNALRTYMMQVKHIRMGAMERIRIVKKGAAVRLEIDSKRTFRIICLGVIVVIDRFRRMM